MKRTPLWLCGLVAVCAFSLSACGASVQDKLAKDSNGTKTVTDNSDTSTGSGATTTAPKAKAKPEIAISDKGFANLPAADEYDEPTTTAAAIIKNPTKDQVATSITVQVAMTGDGGAVLNSESFNIAALPPGQSTAVSLSKDNLTGVTGLTVQARVDDWQKLEKPIGVLTVSGLKVTPQEYGGADLNGTVTSTAGEDLEDLEVNIVFRDGGGKLVGGTSTYLDFVPANGTAPLTTTTYESIPGDWKAEGFVTVTSLTLLGN